MHLQKRHIDVVFPEWRLELYSDAMYHDEAEDGEERQNRCQDDRLCESFDDDRDNDEYRQDIEKSRPRKYIRESNRRDAFGLAVRVVPGAQLREDPESPAVQYPLASS